jgi:hypothetical protein
MSSIIENVVVEVVVEKKPKAKSFAQKDKKTMYSIMGFLLNLKELGILDDDKVMECLEALPLYKTAAEKTAFFQQEMFDTKKVEDELYKPMVSDYKKAKKTKKEKKQVSEKKPRVKKVPVEGEVVKEKKPRVKKAKVVVEEASVPVVEEASMPVEEASVPVPEVKEKKPRVKKEKVDGEPKRGRKPKEQIVELAQEQSNNSVEEEESLDMLIQSMNQKEEPSQVPVLLEEIQVEDIDDILRELEAEEIVEQVVTPRVSTPILKEKKKVKTVEDKEKPVKKTKKSSVVVDNNN